MCLVFSFFIENRWFKSHLVKLLHKYHCIYLGFMYRKTRKIE